MIFYATRLQTLPSATPPQKLTNFHVNLNKLFTHEIWASSFCAVDCSWMAKSWISLVSLNYLAFLRIIKLTYLACINALKFYARLLLTRNFWIAFFINQKWESTRKKRNWRIINLWGVVSPRLQLLLRFFVSHCHCRVRFFSSSPLSSVGHNLAEWIECGLIKSFDVSIRWKVPRQWAGFEVEMYKADCCYQAESHKLVSTIVKYFGAIKRKSLNLYAMISKSTTRPTS